MKVRNVLLLMGIGMLLGLVAMAQDTPKFEVAVDYSYARYNATHNYASSYSLNGGGGGVDFNFTKYLGIKMDLQGYGSNTQTFHAPSGSVICPLGCSANLQGNLFTYLFGPQIGIRTGKLRPFGQFLVGGAHSNVYGNLEKVNGIVLSKAPSGNTFALAVGGGLDIPVNHSGTIAIRPVEVDYLYTRFNNSATSAQSNFQYKGGVVFNF
jgi:Outer membrane protein beta-barrel domain